MVDEPKGASGGGEPVGTVTQEDVNKLKSVYDKALDAKGKEVTTLTSTVSALTAEIELMKKDLPSDKAQALERERELAKKGTEARLAVESAERVRHDAAALALAAQAQLTYGVAIDPAELGKKGTVAEMESAMLRAVVDAKSAPSKDAKPAPKAEPKKVVAEGERRFPDTSMAEPLAALFRKSLPNFRG